MRNNFNLLRTSFYFWFIFRLVICFYFTALAFYIYFQDHNNPSWWRVLIMGFLGYIVTFVLFFTAKRTKKRIVDNELNYNKNN